MTAVMQGVRVLEVAEHTFVPAASALLADWGAEIIKIEHVERGDAMRGLASSGLALFGTKVHVLLEHSNRGKKSLGLDLSTDEGLAVLYKIAESCDVFLTNKLPGVRTKLKIDVDDIRAHNPDIIYVAGTGQGERGPDADKGSYDALGYWNRAGIAVAIQPEDASPPPPPAPAFGDSIGAMTIAGGIMGALFHREKTGEATTVDVSLLAVGMWSMGAAAALSMQFEMPWSSVGMSSGYTGNPLVGTYATSDGRYVSLSCLQAFRYWADACNLILEQPELATDERFGSHENLTANANEATDLVRAAFATKDLETWRQRLEVFTGQWTAVQNTLEAVDDRQSVANGYVSDCATKEGEPFRLITAPVQYGGVPAQPGRAPEFNEHGDDILQAAGFDMDAIIDLKVKGVVA